MPVIAIIIHLLVASIVTSIHASDAPSETFQRSWSSDIALASIENEHLSSSSYTSFSWLLPSSGTQELLLRRLMGNGSDLTCRLHLNNTPSLDDLVSLLPSELELLVLSSAAESVLLAVDMADCSSQSWELARGAVGPFFAGRQENRIVDVFYQRKPGTDGLLPCGGSLCRMTYDVARRNMSEPMPFELLVGNAGEVASAGRDQLPVTKASSFEEEIGSVGASPSGYYFLSKRGILASVDFDGTVLRSRRLYEGSSALHPWEFDYSHGYFGHCYVDMKESERVRCLQTDAQLRLTLNSSYEFADIAQSLAIRNAKDGGLWLLVRYCVERCSRYRTHLTRARIGEADLGKHLLLAEEENCDDYYARTLGFFEEDGQTCLIGRCYVVPKDYRSLDRHFVHVKCL